MAPKHSYVKTFLFKLSRFISKCFSIPKLHNDKAAVLKCYPVKLRNPFCLCFLCHFLPRQLKLILANQQKRPTKQSSKISSSFFNTY